jgi:mRNA interferase MazF
MGLIIKRGDIVVCVMSGDYGKPRPAVVVQSDFFNNAHPSLTVCPITSDLSEVTLFRLLVRPDEKNGLKKPSQIMVDKMTAVRRNKISQVIGLLSFKELQELNDTLKLWLELN